MTTMRIVLLFFASIAVVLMFSCDTTETKFEDSVPEVFTVTTNADPVEGGSVIPSTDEFLEGSQIEIEAIPEEGWIFQGWEGDLEGSVNPDSITVDGNKTITARFTQGTHELNIQIEGQGNVETEEVLTNEDESIDEVLAKKHNSVSERESPAITIDEKSRFDELDSIGDPRSPNAVLKDTFQEINNDNRTQENHFRTVRLTAVPADGWEFVRWEQDLEGNENPTTIVLDEDKDITAVFEPSEGSSTIEIITQPSQTSAGTAISPAPEVRLLNGQNNPIEGVDVTVSEQGGYSLGGTVTATTGTEGYVTFDDLVIQQAGSYTLVFSAEEINGQTTSNAFDIVAAAGDPAQTTATVPDGSVGNPTTISITVEDQFGNRVSGGAGNLSVSVSAGPNTGTDFSNISDDGNGTYSTSYTPTETGTDEITIQLSGSSINGSPFTSEIITTDADAITIQTQPGSTVAGVSIEGPPAVEVTDDLGNPVMDVGVTVSEQGGYSFDSGTTTVPTDGSGIATFNDLEITTSGTFTLVFDAVGVSSDAVSNQFDITAAGVDASASGVTASSPHAADGEDASTVTIELADRFGNAISGLADGDFAIELSGSGSPSRTAVEETGTAGTYQTEVTSTTAGDVTVTVTADGVQLEDQPSITFEAGSASALSITQQPAATTTAGQTIDGPPSVLVEDSEGNPVSGVEVAVSLSGGSFSSNSTTTATTNSSGVAGFDNLIVRNAGTYTMEFTASGLSQTSNSFEITAAGVDASASGVTASSPHAADGEDASTVTIELADRFGNAISGLADGDFAIELSGSGSPSRTAVEETGTAGTYQTEVTSTTAGDVTVTVTADGVQLEDQPSITFEAGSAANIEIVTQPGQTATGQPISGPPAVLLTDAQNNPVNGVDLTVSEQGGYVFDSGTTTRATGMDGIATFDDLVINTVGTYTLEFALVSDGSSSAISSNSFNVEANSVGPSQSTVSANPETVSANGSDASTVTIELRDNGGNPIGGLTDGDFIIDVTGSASAGTVSETTTGTYETSVTNMTAETVTVTVTADGVQLEDQPSITFETGSADGITIDIQPSNTTAGQTIDPTPAVLATDSEGNPVSEVDVEISLSSGTFASGTLTRMTDESGIATFNDLVINTAGTYTLEFALSSDETVSAISNSFDITAAEVDASVSSVTATSPDEFTDVSTVTIEVADQFGNAIGGLTERNFDIDLSGRRSTIRTSIRETGTAGTYQMEVVNKTGEEITVTVTVNGVTLDDTPEIEFDD